jgi:hypothetical protein
MFISGSTDQCVVFSVDDSDLSVVRPKLGLLGKTRLDGERATVPDAHRFDKQPVTARERDRLWLYLEFTRNTSLYRHRKFRVVCLWLPIQVRCIVDQR